MAFMKHHTILVQTPATGSFVRVEGQVVNDWYSYKFAETFQQREVIYEGDDTWHVLIEGQRIPRVVCEALVRAAVAGQFKITKFLDFL